MKIKTNHCEKKKEGSFNVQVFICIATETKVPLLVHSDVKVTHCSCFKME
jgi:hypothetical protein